MTTYIAFLRGINLGGKNIIKMSDLKKTFESIALKEVKTYIQSGNVIFKSYDGEEFLKKEIECVIEKTFGLSLSVIIRTADELNQVMNNCPFSKEKLEDYEKASDSQSFYIALLSHVPAQEKILEWGLYSSDNDEFQVVGRDIFLLFSNSIRNSKLANHLYKLDVEITVRNWKTFKKISILAKSMDT